MKIIYAFVFAFVFASPLFAQNNNVGVGTTSPDPTALLDINSNSKGVLVPRLTTAQRTGIASPAQGLLVYDTDLGCFYYYNSTTSAWVSLCQAGPAGPTGAQGVAGTNGPTGPSGADGLTGATGPAGVAGTNGPTGPSGANGPTGPVGPTGAAGVAGVTGATGPAGTNGTNGTNGANGTNGTNGTNGSNGTTGPTGPSGATGPTGTASAINIQSVSLSASTTLNATAFTNLPGLTLTVTPTQSQTFIEFTASGAGKNNAAEIAYFQILVNGTAVGGCANQAAMTNTWDGYNLFGWNVAFSRMVPVNPNVANTITVQYYSNSVVGGSGLTIDPTTGYSHGTLTAFVQ